MSYINQEFDLLTTATDVIMLDRWSTPSYTVQVDSGTSVLVEGTTDRINRGETPTWETLEGTIAGAVPAVLTTLAALTPAVSPATIKGPFEAIRITATGTCVGRVMQTGAD